MIRIVKAFQQLKIKDLAAPFIFLLILIPSLAIRLTNKISKRRMWLIAEQGDARDNGYHFYKYIREKHPSDYCFYAVKPESAGYKKVEKLGNIVKWGSLKHWLYYMSANLNISSQKSGNPCPIFWYVLHVTLSLYRNRVFLQHGITKDDAEWIYYKKTKFKHFVCGVEEEYDYIREKFGYPEGSLLLTGFPRWDVLEDTSKNQKHKSILIMPTWRNWLGGEKNSVFEIKDFEKTSYFQNWNKLLNDSSFIDYIEQNNIKVYFYPHANMQRFIKSFSSSSDNIELVRMKSDIQRYFKKCSLMITDYSSVAFDFAYLDKLVIYYQFDLNKYRNRQYHEGYFKYERDGFGPVVREFSNLVRQIKCLIEQKDTKKYHDRSKHFFKYHDSKNSVRLYNALIVEDIEERGDD